MAKKIRQITFRIPVELWEKLSIQAIKEGRNKTSILIDLIREYLKKK